MGLRAFFAFELDPGALGLLTAVREVYLDTDPSWAGEKWVSPENLHVTVAFMPSLPESEVERLVHDVSATLESSRTFDLVVDGVRAVPRMARTRMLWGTFARDDDPAVREIATIVTDAARGHMDPRMDHRFTPHVTLARARRQRPCRDTAIASASASILAADLGIRTVSVRSVTLFSSTLGPAGPTYEVLSRAPIGVD